MASAIMGSPEMKLEHAFRMVALKIVDKLPLQDCRNLAYVSACMDDQVVSPYHANFRLHVLTSLESRGFITPTKLDFLEDILRNLGRNDLLDVIEDYKKTREYKKAIKKRNKKLTGRKQSREKGTAAILHPSDKDQYEKLYAQFLTQFSRLSVSMRAALESNDLLRMKLAFSNVAAGAKELSCTMRKTVSEIDNYSSSSRESSATTSVENIQSPSPRSSSSSSEGSQNPEKFAPQSEVSQLMLPPPVSCQPSSPSTLTKEHRFVYCHPCRIPENIKMASEDYYSSGTGTSDSGVGDIHHHTPSYKALRQLDPACRSGQDNPDRQRGDVPPTPGYMQLLIPQDNPEENYMKMTSTQESWGDPSENYMLMTFNSESMKSGDQ